MLIPLPSRQQRTLRRSAAIEGIGFLTGSTIHVRFQPAPPDSGIVFIRSDSKSAAIPALASSVSGTNRRTTLGRASHQLELVEHVLSAFHGLRIDNCCIEIDGPELPGLDGSARGFVDALLDAGLETQDAPRDVWTVRTPITLREGETTLTLYPDEAADLRVSYLLDYGPWSPIATQRHTHTITPEAFCHGLADARTFLLKEEAEALAKQGLGAKTSLADLVVFGPNGPLENTLRAANEPARHKVLDIVGDLALVGCDLRGHVVGCRSGHALNVALARRLRAEIDAAKPRTLRRAA